MQVVVVVTKLQTPVLLVVRTVTSNANRFRNLNGTLERLQGIVPTVCSNPSLVNGIFGCFAGCYLNTCCRLRSTQAMRAFVLCR